MAFNWRVVAPLLLTGLIGAGAVGYWLWQDHQALQLAAERAMVARARAGAGFVYPNNRPPDVGWMGPGPGWWCFDTRMFGTETALCDRGLTSCETLHRSSVDRDEALGVCHPVARAFCVSHRDVATGGPRGLCLGTLGGCQLFRNSFVSTNQRGEIAYPDLSDCGPVE